MIVQRLRIYVREFLLEIIHSDIDAFTTSIHRSLQLHLHFDWPINKFVWRSLFRIDLNISRQVAAFQIFTFRPNRKSNTNVNETKLLNTD